MIIGCPNCTTKFEVPDGALGDEGRKVRCAKCSHVWFATPGDVPAAEAPPTAETPAVETPADEPTPPADDTPASPDDGGDDQSEALASENLEDDEEGDGSVGDEREDEENFAESLSESAADDDEDDGALADLDDDDDEDDGDESLSAESEIETETASPKVEIKKEEDNAAGGMSKGILIGWIALPVFLLVVIMSFLMFSSSMMKIWPASTALYEMLGMVEEQVEEVVDNFVPSEYVRITSEAGIEQLADGSPALVVRGTLTNTSERDIMLPRARGVLKNEARQVIHEWTFDFDESTIRAGKTTPYISSVPNPPVGVASFELFLLWAEPR